jgi:hypothetical protein
MRVFNDFVIRIEELRSYGLDLCNLRSFISLFCFRTTNRMVSAAGHDR